MKFCSMRMGPAVGAGLAGVLALALLSGGVATVGVTAAPAENAQPDKVKPASSRPKTGLLVNQPTASPGYTLLASSNSTITYLIDLEGRVVQSWKSDCLPGFSAYLLENGNLLRAGQVRNPPFFGGGAGGRIQEFTWDGEIVWDFTYVNQTQLPNHDICRLPNGNVLMNIWEKKSPEEAIAAGRRPETVGKDHLLSASILEVQPTGKTTGKIVWEWHVWDHLIQDHDSSKANYGDVGAHPELIDINFGDGTIAAMVAKPKELEKLQAIGYFGGPGRGPQRAQPDWLHINAVAYNAELDQIVLSVYEFNEIWVIDHSTKTAEAAGHRHGRQGKGGDLLYRWGNPRAYRAGTIKDQRLFGQHDSHWIPKGRPGKGHILVFNNGVRRTGGAHSTVDEIVPPVDAKGSYSSTKGKAFGPEKAVWTYVAPKRTDFYAPFISGAQRLPNGNTLICSGTNGTVFEVTPKNEIVWKYVNPAKNSLAFGGPPGGPPPGGGPPGGGPPGGGPPGGGPPGGGPPPFAPPKLGQILPSFLQGFMNFTPEQKKQLEAVEKEIGENLVKMLTAEQKKESEARPRGFDPGAFPLPGQLMASSVQQRLKLTNEQKKKLDQLQNEADDKLKGILNEDQKKQLKQMQDMAKTFARGPGGPGGGTGGPGGGTGGPPGGFPGFPGFGAPGGSGLFRAPRYTPDYPGLARRELKPGKTIEDLEAASPAKVPSAAPKDK